MKKIIDKCFSTRKNKIFSIISIVIFICIIVFGIVIYKENNIVLTEKEKYAVQCINTLKESLKDPESLVIHNVYFLDGSGKFEADENGWNEILIVDYNATNSYGGSIRDTTVFNQLHEVMEDGGDYFKNSENKEQLNVKRITKYMELN